MAPLKVTAAYYSFNGRLYQMLLKPLLYNSICKQFSCLLVPTALEGKGLGGAVKVHIACNGCGVTPQYANSMVCLTQRRNCFSLALGLWFFIWRHGYPLYHKILKLGLGIQTLTYGSFYNIIKVAHPFVKSILDGI